MLTQSPDICSQYRAALVQSGIFPETAGPLNTWRIAPEPFYLSAQDTAFFHALGGHLLKFYTVLNRFYADSVKGKLPRWFAEYLDLGKPADLVDYGRMNRFRRQLPGIIRPDVLPTESGFAITELDSIPGGFGVLALLMRLYGRAGKPMIGEEKGGVPALFYKMLESVTGIPGCAAAIAVSDEAADYLPEMVFLGSLLREQGFPVYTAHPRDLRFEEEGLFLTQNDRNIRLGAVYRFFELFDLKNIQKSELVMYANKKEMVTVTPPYKPWLEEKLAFALFHHPVLTPHWENALGGETFSVLRHLIPKTWVLDNRDIPPQGVIPGLLIQGKAVQSWEELYGLTQKEREMVIKPSGFSPDAWGGRGVTIGHDVPAEEWRQTLESSLSGFKRQPYILQEFHKAKRFKTAYGDTAAGGLKDMEARVRLTPYYFTVGETAELGGILATLCPHDKKKIHGMADAVLVPCARAERG